MLTNGHIEPGNIDSQFFDHFRFKLTVFETRFGYLEYFVRDAEVLTDDGIKSDKNRTTLIFRSTIVFQTHSYKDARRFIRDHSGSEIPVFFGLNGLDYRWT